MARVIEIGGYAAGYAGRLFQRAGDDVVRLDQTCAPSWASDEAMELFLHTGKRRVAGVDEQTIASLVEAADVVVCQFSNASEFENLRDLVKDHNRAVITPFGLTGPKANWAATPSTLLAMGGYTYMMGDADKAPLSLPGHYLEFQAGTLAFATLKATQLAEKSELIDIGMLETLMSLSQFTTVRWHCAGDIRSRHGSDFWFVSPSDLFRCADGWVYINIVPTFWDAFLAFIDLPDLVVDERFEGNDGRMTHRQELLARIAERFLELSKAEIEQRAADCRVPLGVVRTLDDVLAEPHLAERDYWETVHTSSGSLKIPGLPFRMSGGSEPLGSEPFGSDPKGSDPVQVER